MAYDWRDALRRRLPHDLASGFPRLPLLCRLFFLSLLDECDAEGRIRVGAGAPAEALAAMLGAHVGERRLVRGYVPQLIAAGLLRHDGAFVTLKPEATEARSETSATNGTSETNRTNETSFTSDGASARKDTTSPLKTEHGAANERNELATNESVTARNDSPLAVKVAEPNESTVPFPPPSSLSASHSTSPISLPSFPPCQPRGGGQSALPGMDPTPSPAEPSKSKRSKASKPAPPPDPVPLDGVAARVYRALLADSALAPITVGPGDFAQRIAADGAYPGVDVLAEVLRAGEHASRKPGVYTDGRRYLANWLRTAATDAAKRPRPIVGAVAANAPAQRPADPRRGIQPPAPASAYDHVALAKMLGVRWPGYSPGTETREQAFQRICGISLDEARARFATASPSAPRSP